MRRIFPIQRGNLPFREFELLVKFLPKLLVSGTGQKVAAKELVSSDRADDAAIC